MNKQKPQKHNQETNQKAESPPNHGECLCRLLASVKPDRVIILAA